VKLAFNVRYIVLGFLVYVIFLVLNFPADRAYAYWKSSDSASSNFALAGISGSVWSGKAGVAAINKVRLENVEWTYRPWVLLLGQVGLSWSFQAPNSQGSYGRGLTSWGLDGGVDFSSLEAQLPASMVASMISMKAIQPSGILVSAEGKVVWRGAGINLLKPVSFGELSLSLETSNDEIKGVLTDNGGPLSAEGLITLAEDGRYQFNGAFAARGDTPQKTELENALRTMGKQGSDGKVKVTNSGTLAKLGL